MDSLLFPAHKPQNERGSTYLQTSHAGVSRISLWSWATLKMEGEKKREEALVFVSSFLVCDCDLFHVLPRTSEGKKNKEAV